jgi:hypothetical protein
LGERLVLLRAPSGAFRDDAFMGAADADARIGSGVPRQDARVPSPEWFPRLVTPQNFLDYWNDVECVHRPAVARFWLSEGYDSSQLRWLAGLGDREAQAVTTEQILGVIGSLGVATEAHDAFLERCGRAIGRLQPDLDATGFGQYRMRPANAAHGHDALPAVYAALPDGRWFASGGAMTPKTDDETLLLVAAESVSDTLVELLHLVWPTCPLHPGPPITLQARADGVGPAWFCGRGNHDVGPLGELADHI